MLSLLLLILCASEDRLDALSPIVNVKVDSSFSKPTERIGRIIPPPEKDADLIWGEHKNAVRPDDILMEGFTRTY